MSRLLLAIAWGLMVTMGGSAGASVPLPIEHGSGPPTLAPLLRKLLPAGNCSPGWARGRDG